MLSEWVAHLPHHAHPLATLVIEKYRQIVVVFFDEKSSFVENGIQLAKPEYGPKKEGT